MNEERIKEIFSDKEFVKELFSKETPEEAKVIFTEKGIQLSLEEIIIIKDLIVKKIEQAERGESIELTEDDLVEVAGGEPICIMSVTIGIVAIAAITALGLYKMFSDINKSFSIRIRW